MSLKDFDIDRIDAPETPEHRTMRAMLRLSNDWKVIGRTVEHLPSEYPDEHPEVREVVDSDDLSGIGKSLGVSRIHLRGPQEEESVPVLRAQLPHDKLRDTLPETHRRHGMQVLPGRQHTQVQVRSLRKHSEEELPGRLP